MFQAISRGQFSHYKKNTEDTMDQTMKPRFSSYEDGVFFFGAGLFSGAKSSGLLAAFMVWLFPCNLEIKRVKPALDMVGYGFQDSYLVL